MKRSTFLTLLCLLVWGCGDGNFDNKEFEGITPALVGESVVTLSVKDYVTVKGTWTIIGENSSTPYNVTEYQCRRELMTCSSAYAELQDYFGPPKLDVGQEILDITEWTDDGIMINSADGCREIETLISLKNRTVTQTVTSNIDLPSCVKDENGDPYQMTLKQPRNLRMMNLKEFQDSMGLE